jgi:ectoine hydroxylase
MQTRHISDLYPSRVGASEHVLSRLDPVVHAPGETWGSDNEFLRIEQIRFFNDNGYLLLPEFFSQSEVAQLHDEAMRLRSDPMLLRRDETVIEPRNREIRSVFDVQRFSTLMRDAMCDRRIVGIARYLLADDPYLHQSRLNYKPAFHGKEFYWHSDFETWHVEDGMPRMRALSVSIALTDNYTCNGPVMVIPGSHMKFISCAGETPQDNYRTSLREQRYGVPSDDLLGEFIRNHGIREIACKAGSILIFDCNLLHGSASNITPYARNNLFFVFNALSNRVEQPYCERTPRPEYIAHRRHIEVL